MPPPVEAHKTVGGRAPPQPSLRRPLLAAGCLGHLLAAQASGGGRVAYTHHILGFVGLTLVSGAVLVGLARASGGADTTSRC